MKLKYLFSLVSTFLMGGCVGEVPFTIEEDNGGEKATCRVFKSALDFDVRADEKIQMKSPSRAEDGIRLDDFTIKFVNSANGQTMLSKSYGELPDVILIEEGSYTVSAVYGEEVDAAWDSPYILGESEEFSVVPNEITTSIGTIACKLQNLKVSIVFDEELRLSMGEDACVEVSVGRSQALKFTVDESRAGFFKVGDEKTLVATFSGTLDGAFTSESKTLTDIEAGNHYRITFHKHIHDDGSHGTATGDVTVNASVDVDDVEKNITVEEDKPLDDSERPNQGEQGGEEPDDPNIPPIEENGPTIIARINGEEVSMDNRYDASTITSCVLYVTSEAEGGIETFKVTIDSGTLTEEVLTGVNLAKELDIVNPGPLKEGLASLGLPVEVGGEKEVEFDISSFMTLLGIYGAADHNFVVTVSDSNGTTTRTLKLLTQ